MEELDYHPFLYPSFAETKVITVPLAAGNFAYTLLQTCDPTGAAKTYYAKGDPVHANIKGKNNGNVSAGASIVVKDLDTGVEVKRIGTEVVAPGAIFTVAAVLIGTMPSKDWRLEFKMTP